MAEMWNPRYQFRCAMPHMDHQQKEIANPMAALLLYYIFCAGITASIYYGFRLAVSARIGFAVRFADSLRPIPNVLSSRDRVSCSNENIVRSRHLAA
jgi:hypothetical protein